MLTKWKSILVNWINCYFNEPNDELPTVLCINSLLNIISHLRENFNLDESKSSILEAHTVNEFIAEKYPSFKFENGTVEPTSEQELHIAASLLLFFVCVNSKDMDIKNAMCCQLSTEDQEIILKFTKRLMECFPILCRDVELAISEACGQDIASVEANITVAETPPVLRSLHSELRRLQAALDAERFDRNYLQEELARTNSRLETLIKDKEKCKLEILNLKAKISMCCDQHEAQGDNANAEGTSMKYIKQLQNLEESLENTQSQLDDAQYERDTYKARVDELKRDRDKWLNACEQKSSQADLLAEELDTEKRKVQSLKELVTELQQHRQLNRLDGSLLECDDPDASMHSMTHNTSIGSEACINVVEVQLREEREKINLLEQEIQSLQEKIQEFTVKSEKDKKNFDTILSQKENEILSLIHRLDEEVGIFNNKIKEQEQQLNKSYEHSRNELENKKHEIQLLQEENLTLLKNLSDQSNKYEKIVEDLEKDLDTEKLSKSKMKEDHEICLLNLNNEISNKNNEVVELNNNIFEKNKIIETLQLQLKKEKEIKDELLNNHDNEILILNEQNTKHVNELLERLNKLNNQLSTSQTELQEKDNIIKDKENYLKEEQNNVERLIFDKNHLNDKVNELSEIILSRNGKIQALEETIQRIDIELGEQREKVALLNQQAQLLQETLQKMMAKSENDKRNYDSVLSEKETEILSLRHYIDEERLKKNIFEEHFNNEICKLNNEINKLEQKLKDSNDHYRNELENKMHEIQILQQNKLSLLQNLSDQSNKFANIVENLEKDLEKERNSKSKIKEDYEKYILNINEKISNRNNEVFELQNNNLEKSEIIEKLQISLRREKEINEEFSNKYNNEIVILNEQNMKNQNELQRELSNLKSELSKLHTELQDKDQKNVKMDILLQEKQQLVERLQLDNNNLDGKLKELYQIISSNNEKIQMHEEIVQRLNDNIRKEAEKVTSLNQQTKSLQDELRDFTKIHKNDKKKYTQMLSDKESEILSIRHCLDGEIAEHNNLNKEIAVLEQKLKESYENSKSEVEKKILDIQTLHEEKLSLLQSLSDHTSKYDNIVKKLQSELEEEKNNNSKIKEDYDSDIAVLQINCNDLKKQLDSMTIEQQTQVADLIEQLNSKAALSNNLEASLAKKGQENVKIQNKIKALNDDLDKLKTEKKILKSKYEECVIKLQDTKALLETNQLNNDEVIIKLKDENQSLFSAIEDKVYTVKNLENDIQQEKEQKQLLSKEVIYKEDLIKELSQKRIELEDMRKQDEMSIRELKKETKSSKACLEAHEQELEVLEQLKTNYKRQEKVILQVTNSVNSGLDELFKKLKEEDTDYEVFKKLSTTHILDVSLNCKCNLLIETVKAISAELSARKWLDKALNDKNVELCNLKQTLGQKEIELEETQAENKKIYKNLDEIKIEFSKQSDNVYTLNSKLIHFNKLELENKSLHNELNDVKVQLEVKVHSLKDKLIDNENLTEKLKETYECQIDNLNVMITKLTNYLRDKTIELDTIKTEKERLQQIIENDKKAIKSLEEDVKSQKQNLVKNITDFESEKLILKNMVTVTESVMEDQKVNLNQVISEQLKSIEVMTEETNALKELLDKEKEVSKTMFEEKESIIKELNELKNEKEIFLYECNVHTEQYENEIRYIKKEISNKISSIKLLEIQKKEMTDQLEKQITAIECLQGEVKSRKLNEEKIIKDFESEKLDLKNMITVYESAIELQKVNLNKIISQNFTSNEVLTEENKALKELLDIEKRKSETILEEKEIIIRELNEMHKEKEALLNECNSQKERFEDKIKSLKNDISNKISNIELLKAQKKEMNDKIEKQINEISCLEEDNQLQKQNQETITRDFESEIFDLKNMITATESTMEDLKVNFLKSKEVMTEGNKVLKELLDHEKQISKTTVEEKESMIKELIDLRNEKERLLFECNSHKEQFENEIRSLQEDISNKISNIELLETKNKEMNDKIQKQIIEIQCLEENIKSQKQYQETIMKDFESERLDLKNMITVTESAMEDLKTNLSKSNIVTTEEIKALKETLDNEKGITKTTLEEKESLIRELNELRNENEKILYECNAHKKQYEMEILHLKEEISNKITSIEVLETQKKEITDKIGKQITVAATSQEKVTSHKHSGQFERDLRDHQVDNTQTSDLAYSSLESIKTISDLERIINDKNRTITTLHSDITYMKSLLAESENKLMDVTKDFELSTEHCQQLSSQLKKIVQQKNEEIAELKKQVTKMSVTENRASQIIKVSAKYQAIILKRIAEIKTNTVLKELTNFGNTANCDNELRRTINSGAITMEDLENFLETTDRHLKRCSEKQLILQRERDRLIEVNRINESEIINLKKFLTELSVSFKTFTSVKDLYSQKLSVVISLQRSVRREILSFDGHITDATMCKLERGYAAIMQDLSECALNLERWVERSIGRTLSPEKIKQAFTSENERPSLASTTFQNASLEVQLEELQTSFQNLLGEVERARQGEGARDAHSVTIMEVRAEYEDKLNRMKAKMKQIYQEQIQVFKDKQREEIFLLQRELQKTRDKMAESCRAYEEHIKSLTTELWNVGEKFLIKKDEAEWLRRKQRSGSVMSLQHVHSSGLSHDDTHRPSDTHSLRSLPVNTNAKSEGQPLHMSDEEGEVFDNRWLKELAATPRRPSHVSPPPGARLSELRWRNSLCPPHLKSSYPAETQFTAALDEEEIKCPVTGTVSLGGKQQRKEVGITAYKKPGPPTPSKQAGRLSATDSELRESLRVELEPQPRKTSTPSRLRSIFQRKNDTAEGTPRSRRLSFFRKK